MIRTFGTGTPDAMPAESPVKAGRRAGRKSLGIRNKWGAALKSGRGAVLVFVLSIFLLGGGVILLWQGDATPATSIEVRGNRYLAGDEVLLLSGLVPGVELGGKQLDKAREAVLKHPVVRDVDFSRNGDVLVLTVFERACAALVRGESAGRLYEIDKELRILSRDEVRCSGLPVISGRFKPKESCSGMDDGCFKSGRLRGLTTGWLRLRSMYPVLARRVSELKARRDGALVLYLSGTGVRIVTAGRLESGDINRIYAALAYLESEGRYKGTIDLRERDGLYFP